MLIAPAPAQTARRPSHVVDFRDHNDDYTCERPICPGARPRSPAFVVPTRTHPTTGLPKKSPKPARQTVDVQAAFAYAVGNGGCHLAERNGDNDLSRGKQQQTMQLVSSWSHYREFRCDDCGETTHVDAARSLPTTATCRSCSCRTSPQQRDGVASGNRPVQIGIPAGHHGCD